MARRRKKKAKKHRSKKAETKARLDSVRKKANRKPRLDSGRKDTEKKPRLDSGRKENEKEKRLASSRKETGKKPTQDFNSKETDKKIRAERKESNKTNVLVSGGGAKILTSSVETDISISTRKAKEWTRATKKRMNELRPDGIIILIDQPNLEIAMRNGMDEGNDDSVSSKKELVMKYSKLKSVLAQGGSGSKPRNVLKMCVVTSERSQEKNPYGLSPRMQKKYDIEYLVSPVRNRRGKEKCVDSIIVRRMVEEYASLDIFRLYGLSVPKRTFCIVSADSDFVDVAKVAREKGFNVELWFFDNGNNYSPTNWEGAEPGKCQSGKCGRLQIMPLNGHRKKITKLTNLEKDRDWTVLQPARGKVEKA